jgi:nucleotide-binding universal stress UspA family protein
MVSGRQILVPVTDDPASLAALDVACRYATREHGTVHAVHVIEVPRTLTIDANLDTEAHRGELVLRRAQDIGEQMKCHVEGALLQARTAATAILDEAGTRKVDTIIVGVRAKRHDGKFVLGATVSTLLQNAPCDVWVIRRAERE